MGIETRTIEYRDGDVTLEGYLAVDEAAGGPRPAVAVAHAWGGRGEYECERARLLAGLGYTGFALDVFGKDVRGHSREENMRLIEPFMEDRGLLQRRLQLGVAVMRDQAESDPRRMAAIGYCFGGLCVLDLARIGADLRGVVSFHGLFVPPPEPAVGPVRARVLALHGNDDPMVPVEQVVALEKELSEAGADWQIHVYGGAMHAFTNPQADDPEFGTVYDGAADRRSWQAMRNFLEEVLA